MPKISVQFILVGLFGVLMLFTSCQTVKNKEGLPLGKQKNQPRPPKGYKPAIATPLTLFGKSEHPRYDRDGKKIIFTSEKQDKHSQPQIYELSLESRKLRRITFQDGINAYPFYHPEGNQIFYSSTTDEIKENTDIMFETFGNKKNEKSEKPLIHPFEIYRSRIDGNNIVRLTQRVSFDGEGDIDPVTNRLVYSVYSRAKKEFDLYVINLNKKRKRKKRSQRAPTLKSFIKNEGHQRKPRWSFDGKNITWLEEPPGNKGHRIVVANSKGSQPKVFEFKEKSIQSLTWHKDGHHIIFSANLDSKDNFELYAIHLKDNCTKRLTYNLANDKDPDVSPDGQRIVFSSNRAGEYQIFQMPIFLQAPCVSLKP